MSSGAPSASGRRHAHALGISACVAACWPPRAYCCFFNRCSYELNWYASSVYAPLVRELFRVRVVIRVVRGIYWRVSSNISKYGINILLIYWIWNVKETYFCSLSNCGSYYDCIMDIAHVFYNAVDSPLLWHANGVCVALSRLWILVLSLDLRLDWHVTVRKHRYPRPGHSTMEDRLHSTYFFIFLIACNQ